LRASACRRKRLAWLKACRIALSFDSLSNTIAVLQWVQGIEAPPRTLRALAFIVPPHFGHWTLIKSDMNTH
jgi:hypothetical protein